MVMNSYGTHEGVCCCKRVNCLTSNKKYLMTDTCTCKKYLDKCSIECFHQVKIIRREPRQVNVVRI